MGDVGLEGTDAIVGRLTLTVGADGGWRRRNGCSSAVLLRNTLRSPKAGTSTIVLTRQAVPFAGWHRCRSGRGWARICHSAVL
jgi:hypothetical protein